MEKGIKNLTQACRSAQKKQNDGSYHDHEDSGIGISDLEEESSPADMPNVSDAHFAQYQVAYPSQQQLQQQQLQHQRVPSIQSMLHPMHHQPQQYYGHPQ